MKKILLKIKEESIQMAKEDIQCFIGRSNNEYYFKQYINSMPIYIDIKGRFTFKQMIQYLFEEYGLKDQEDYNKAYDKWYKEENDLRKRNE